MVFFFEACLVSMMIESPKTLGFPKDFYGHSNFLLNYNGNQKEIKLKYYCQYKYFWTGRQGWEYSRVPKPERFSIEIEKNHHFVISNPFCLDQKELPRILDLNTNELEIKDIQSIEEKNQSLKKIPVPPILNFSSERLSEKEFGSDNYSDYTNSDKFKEYKFCQYSVRIYNLNEIESILRETKYPTKNDNYVLIDDIRERYSLRINLEKQKYTLKYLKKDKDNWNLTNLTSYPKYYPSLTFVPNWNINYNQIQYKPGAILIDIGSNFLFDTNTPEPCMF